MNEKSMTLLRTWDGIDPAGWIMSEKYDGCRAYWDGEKFWTREGNVIAAPDWFTAGLPKTPLDGEIWAGRGGFASASNAVRFGSFNASISFMIFDAPNASGIWLNRLATVRHRCATAEVVATEVCLGRQHLIDYMKSVQQLGGEGLVIRDPRVGAYVQGRTRGTLRVKAVPPVFGLLKLLKRKDAYYGG